LATRPVVKRCQGVGPRTEPVASILIDVRQGQLDPLSFVDEPASACIAVPDGAIFAILGNRCKKRLGRPECGVWPLFRPDQLGQQDQQNRSDATASYTPRANFVFKWHTFLYRK
jgi:hypothetical protein